MDLTGNNKSVMNEPNINNPHVSGAIQQVQQTESKGKIKFSCPACFTNISMEANYVGTAACPRCGYKFDVNLQNNPPTIGDSEMSAIVSAVNAVDSGDQNLLLALGLQQIRDSINKISNAIWLIFFWIPVGIAFFWWFGVGIGWW